MPATRVRPDSDGRTAPSLGGARSRHADPHRGSVRRRLLSESESVAAQISGLTAGVFSEMTPRGALILHKLSGTAPIEIGVRPGSELTFHASAQGKVMLAFAPQPLRTRVLARPLQRFTDKTIMSVRRIEQELLEIARLGFASAPEEAMLGLNAVAAPIFDAQDACIASVALVGSIQFLPEKPRPSDVAQLIDAARQISRKLGHGRSADQPAPSKRGLRTARVRQPS